jgi:cysteine-rich repeat protein
MRKQRSVFLLALGLSLLVAAAGPLGGCVFDESGVGPPGVNDNANNGNQSNQNHNQNDNQNQNNNNHAGECGDGVLDLGELCDDGNTAGTDGCSAGCEVEAGWVCPGEPSQCTPRCGDGLLRGAEACDDGNLSPLDGCDIDCQVEAGYDCAGEPSVCQSVCGDGVIAVGAEGCDDQNTTGGDGCSDTCVVEPGWVCWGEPSTCAETCGDSTVDAGEVCDDGNNDPCVGDCAADCSRWAHVCGDGFTECGEACDDGNNDPCTGGCAADCSRDANVCGDGIVECAEACDDSNTDPCTGGCAADCSRDADVCGDGIVECAEACDDGNLDPCTGGCAADCSRDANVCGDGIAECAEPCDGADLNGEDCDSASGGALPSGTLVCTSACAFDLSNCSILATCVDHAGCPTGQQCEGDVCIAVGNTCDDGPHTLSAGTVSHTLENLTNDYNGGINGLQCPGIAAGDTAGVDRTYAVTLALGDWVTVWLSPQGFNGVLYLLDACAGAGCPVGANEARAGPSRERLDFVAPSAGTYYLVVDGMSGQGDYTLEVSRGTVADYAMPAEGDLIFTEVHAEPEGVGSGATDDCEWLEIANPGSGAVLFYGAQLNSPDGSYVVSRPLVVQPSEHVVFARYADRANNCGLDWVSRAYAWSGGFNLYDAAACLIEIEFNSVIIDDIDYQSSGWPFAPGQSMHLCTNYYHHSDNDSSGNWRTTPAAASYEYDPDPPKNYGTPRLSGPSTCP